MAKKKKGAGGKLNRSEIVQTRLDPKLRFTGEIISRLERKTISSLIETSLENYSKNCTVNVLPQAYRHSLMFLPPGDSNYIAVQLPEAIERVWNSNEAVRLVAMALIMPHILNINEESLWHLIQASSYFWAHYAIKVIDEEGNFLEEQWVPIFTLEGLIKENLQWFWDEMVLKGKIIINNIPSKIGKKVTRPASFPEQRVLRKKEGIYMDLDPNSDEEELLNIWHKNISSLIKKKIKTIKTPEGTNKTVRTIAFPTALEQQEMIERIYKEKNHGN